MRSLDYIIMLILAVFLVWLLVLTTRGSGNTVGNTTGRLASPSTDIYSSPSTPPGGLQENTLPESSVQTLPVPSASSSLPSPSTTLRSPSPRPSATLIP